MSSDWLTIHVRFNDADTQQPTPVRARFQARGKTVVPLGRLSDPAHERGVAVGGHLCSGNEEFVYVEGTCEIRLPQGEVLIEATKGPEYTPITQVVQLKPGQMSIRLSIQRWADFAKQGWFSGDTHVLFLSPHAALLEAACEDLAVVQLLAFADLKSGSLPSLLAFSGQGACLQRDGHLVAVGTRNTHPRLGTLSLLFSHRVVYPLRFGDPEGYDDWSLADWCEQCRRKNGLVVWTDLGKRRLGSEALANVILGQIDAYEITTFPSTQPIALEEWYQILNTGYRLPLVGGSGKDSNTIALGAVRTYARLEPERSLSYSHWIEAVRLGRTFVTNGPLLTITVEEQIPGTLLTVSSGQTVRVCAEVNSQVPVDSLEIVINGSVVGVKEASGDRGAARWELDWPVQTGCWIAARCWTDERLSDDQYVFAHTSPIYVAVEGQPFAPDESALECLKQHLEETLQWTREEARYENEKQRAHLEAIFTSALEQLLSVNRS